jgi:hypothetical protein
MLVLSGVCNTRILDTMNYTNQDYVHVNYTLIVIYSMLLVTGSQSKNVSCFCLDMAAWQNRAVVFRELDSKLKQVKQSSGPHRHRSQKRQYASSMR